MSDTTEIGDGGSGAFDPGPLDGMLLASESLDVTMSVVPGSNAGAASAVVAGSGDAVLLATFSSVGGVLDTGDARAT